jgi:hypothetical protein
MGRRSAAWAGDYSAASARFINFGEIAIDAMNANIKGLCLSLHLAGWRCPHRILRCVLRKRRRMG